MSRQKNKKGRIHKTKPNIEQEQNYQLAYLRECILRDRQTGQNN